MQAKAIKDFLFSINENKFFQFFIITVIVLSALLIGAKTYDIDPTYLAILE